MQSKNFRAYPRRAQRTSGGDGTDFVRCRICGKHLRVISGRHLSTHDTDRKTYIQEYRLGPDKLCSKSFRVNHSSRSDYRPHGKREWIAAIKKVYKRDGQVFAMSGQFVTDAYFGRELPEIYLDQPVRKP